MKCPLCNKGKLVKKKTSYTYGDIHFGEFDSEVCTKCGETIFTEEAFDAIEAKAKELGVWGIAEKRSSHTQVILWLSEYRKI
ncbi:MAG: YgiT-type zinc finger protein [Candidatus Thermoplasmatota archaeon]